MAMTEEEFWKRKRYSMYRFLAGSILFLMIVISMLLDINGKDMGIIATIICTPVPLGCVILAFLCMFNVIQANKMLRWPSPLDAENILNKLKVMELDIKRRMKEFEEQKGNSEK